MPRSWRVREPTVPEPGSLYDILYQHQGTALFVRPILWTDQHMELLRTQFVARAPIVAPVPDSHAFSQELRPSRLVEWLKRELMFLLSEGFADMRLPEKDNDSDNRGRRDDVCWQLPLAEHMHRLLATFYPVTWSGLACGRREFRLFFGQRGYRCYLQASATWTRKNTTTSTSANPVMAYVSRAMLESLRRVMFSSGRSLHERNDPVRRLLSIKLKEVLPRDADRDAYLVALFVAMAQAHFYADGQETKASGSLSGPLYREVDKVAPFADVPLRIVTHDETTSDFLVYAAVVTASFLQRFLTPTKAASAGATDGLRITLVRVPAYPIVGLKERLGQALGDDFVGEDLPKATDEDADDVYRGMETWETTKDRQARLAAAREAKEATEAKERKTTAQGTKRKRDETGSAGSTSSPTTSTSTSTTASPPARKKQRTRPVQVC